MSVMRDKFRAWLMEFLGLLGLERSQQKRHDELMLLNRDLAESLDRVETRLSQIEQRLQSQHVNRRAPSPSEYDWDTVQSMALDAITSGKQEN